MKNIKTIALALLGLAFFSFTTLKQKNINVEKSTIKWVGKKITGQHEGVIGIKSGQLEFKDSTLVGGNFVIDMSTIRVTDLKANAKFNLEKHLKSDDFFGVDAHKTASLKFAKVVKNKSGYTVTGDFTIKGITKQITFNMAIKNNSATAKVVIDRTEFGIKYKSGSFFNNLKDKAIEDNFDLDINLQF